MSENIKVFLSLLAFAALIFGVKYFDEIETVLRNIFRRRTPLEKAELLETRAMRIRMKFNKERQDAIEEYFDRRVAENSAKLKQSRI